MNRLVFSFCLMLSCCLLAAQGINIPKNLTTNLEKQVWENDSISEYGKLKKSLNGIDITKDTLTLITTKQIESKPPNYLLYYAYNYDFYTTFMLEKAENPIDPSADKDNLFFYYNFTFNSRVNIKKFRWNFYFFNEYGRKKYFDSFSVKTDDLYYFKNSFNQPIIKNKIAINLMANVKSQFWTTYNYREDTNGLQQRYKYSSYFSPGYILYSSGITYNFWENSSAELGLLSGKITKIKHQYIFDERATDKLYGLKKGQKGKVQFGLNLQFNVITKKFGKHIIWEHFSQTYMPNEHFGDISNVTFEMNNALHYLFLKYLRVSVRTKVNYDQNIQEKPQIINQLSIGFYLSNIVQ